MTYGVDALPDGLGVDELILAGPGRARLLGLRHAGIGKTDHPEIVHVGMNDRPSGPGRRGLPDQDNRHCREGSTRDHRLFHKVPS